MNVSIRKVENGFLLEVSAPDNIASAGSPIPSGWAYKTYVFTTLEEVYAKLQELYPANQAN